MSRSAFKSLLLVCPNETAQFERCISTERKRKEEDFSEDNKGRNSKYTWGRGMSSAASVALRGYVYVINLETRSASRICNDVSWESTM